MSHNTRQANKAAYNVPDGAPRDQREWFHEYQYNEYIRCGYSVSDALSMADADLEMANERGEFDDD